MWFLATSLSPGLYQRCSMPFPCEGGGEAGRDEEEMGERGHQTHGMGRGKTCLRRGPRSLLLSPAVCCQARASRRGGQFAFAFGGFDLKTRLVRQSRRCTLANTGGRPGLGAAVLPLGTARRQPER